MRSAALLAGLALLLCANAVAELSGTVFVDTNGDGEWSPGEAGLAGVRVSNGREVQITGPEGVYRFDDDPSGFVRLTRPDDYACETWYRRGSGDFALTPAPTPDDFFFIQMSDIHAHEEPSEFARYTLPDTPTWIPARLAAWGLLWAMRAYYPGHDRDEIAGHFSRALPAAEEERSRSETLLEYLAEFERPGSELGNVVSHTRSALAEVAAMAPEFAIVTGDLVVEANTAPPEVVEAWFELYDALLQETGLVVFNTIGNNEVAGTRLDTFPLDDPRYGKGLFERFYGPTTFSFDRGPFHFVAVDTHRRSERRGRRPEWAFEELGADVEQWLDADLAAHRDRVLVVLNHEPFHSLPEWSFYDPVDDRGLFARHGVAYSLAGHIHKNGVERLEGTLHITSGALSGMRWVVPASLHPRGYRLFYAKGRRLFSAWKETGKPLLGFVAPAADARLFATGEPGPGQLVAVGADASGPFASLELLLDGNPLESRAWGRFFIAATLPEGGEGGELLLRAHRQNGEVFDVSLETGER